MSLENGVSYGQSLQGLQERSTRTNLMLPLDTGVGHRPHRLVLNPLLGSGNPGPAPSAALLQAVALPSLPPVSQEHWEVCRPP